MVSISTVAAPSDAAHAVSAAVDDPRVLAGVGQHLATIASVAVGASAGSFDAPAD